MKAEHRKELQTNYLADHLGRWLQGLKAGPKSSTVVIWMAVLVIAALVAGWWFWSKASAKDRSALWLKLDEATNAEELAKLAKDNRGTIPAQVARSWEDRTLFQQGVQDLYSPQNRAEALEKLKKAQEMADKLAAECKELPILTQEALMTAAQAHESVGELDKAKAFYDKLVKLYPNSALGKQAAAALKRSDAQAFYDKLNELANAARKE